MIGAASGVQAGQTEYFGVGVSRSRSSKLGRIGGKALARLVPASNP